MQLSAKTRDQSDHWKYTKRITPLFPAMTDFGYMAMRVARSAGMMGDEILLPATFVQDGAQQHADGGYERMGYVDSVVHCPWGGFRSLIVWVVLEPPIESYRAVCRISCWKIPG